MLALIYIVKGIYAGLVMVKAKYIDVDEEQSHLAVETSRREPLKTDQWQSCIQRDSPLVRNRPGMRGHLDRMPWRSRKVLYG